MRKLVLALFSSMVLAAPLLAAENWANNLFKDGLTHDFGNVPHGSQLYHRFIITNIYAVPLKVTGLRTSCNVCSTVSSSTVSIKPKETGWVDVFMDARKFTGQKNITIMVTVGDGSDYMSTTELKISANSRTDIVFNPGSVNFGNIQTGKKATQTIEVEYAGQLDWKVNEVNTNDGPFEASIKELYRKPGKVGYEVAVTLKEDAPPGTLRHEFFLKTNDPASKTVPIVVEAILQSALSVSPEKITLGSDVKVGDEITRKVVVRGAKPFKVIEVDGIGESIEIAGKMPEKSAAVQTLTFKCKPDKDGDFKKTLLIKTDLQEKPVSVLIEGKVEPADKPEKK
jgi:hypothetical protein